jgi:hypothetical protein
MRHDQPPASVIGLCACVVLSTFLLLGPGNVARADDAAAEDEASEAEDSVERSRPNESPLPDEQPTADPSRPFYKSEEMLARQDQGSVTIGAVWSPADARYSGVSPTADVTVPASCRTRSIVIG